MVILGYNEAEIDKIIIEALIEKEEYGQLSPQTIKILNFELKKISGILNKNDKKNK